MQNQTVATMNHYVDEWTLVDEWDDACHAMLIPDFSAGSLELAFGRSVPDGVNTNTRDEGNNPHVWAVKPSDGRMFAPDGFDYSSLEERRTEHEGEDISGWLLCSPTKSHNTRENVIRSMRISIIMNLWQVRHDPQESLDWFEQLDQHIGMPALPPDEYPDDMAWERIDGSFDPLNYLLPYELARLYNWTYAASQENVNSVVLGLNGVANLKVQRFIPLRIVRTGKNPHPFALAQPLGITDDITLAFSDYMVRFPFASDHEVEAGDVYLTGATMTDLMDHVFELKHTGHTKGFGCVIKHLETFNLPSIANRLSLPTVPIKVGRQNDSNEYHFSSYQDGYAFRYSEDLCHNLLAPLFAFEAVAGDDAHPEHWIPTWKDYRRVKTLDYASPYPVVWSDFINCGVCNQRTRVLFNKETKLPTVACPSCKAEDGINTEHLMSGNIPAVLGIVANTDGEPITE